MERTLLAVLIGLGLIAGAIAQNDTDSPGPVRVPDVIVTAEAGGTPLASKLTRPLRNDPTRDLAQALMEIPGVAGLSRGSDFVEPMIRGLGWERVMTTVDGLPMYGACPARMDPPINYLHGQAASRVAVDLALPSLTLGPPGTAGRIRTSTWLDRKPTPKLELGGWIEGTVQTGRDGRKGSIGVEGSAPHLVFRGTYDALRLDDYKSPDGVDVPNDQEGYAASLTLQLEPAPGHTWRHTLIDGHEHMVQYPSLPMDLDDSDLLIYTTAYRWEPDGDDLRALELWFGLQQLDHTMSNTNKATWNKMRAATASTSDVLAGGLKVELPVADDGTLTLGADTYHLERDASRARVMMPGGMTYRDHLWPDASQTNLGIFAELDQPVAEQTRLRLGLRLDTVRSRASGLDDKSLQNKSIRQQIATWYGSDAASADDVDEQLLSGNLLVEHHLNDAVMAYGGVGYSQRPASVTERFFAFAAAPGGAYQLGNPGLDPESKVELVTGVQGSWERVESSLSVYHAWVHDYILPYVLTRTDVNGDQIPDPIRGFRNIDAALYGGEATLAIRPIEHWKWSNSLAMVRGRNLTDAKDLPEIPPLDVRTALRAEYGENFPWWAELGLRYAARQGRIDSAYPENATEAFTVVNAKAEVALTERLSVQAGVRNLFDQNYNEHLTREAAVAVGDLAAGDEVPAEGRVLYLSVRLDF